MPVFQVQLDAYHGPLDLLLYLVKKEELPIAELPLALVAQQYLDYVAVIERLDPNAVGDFLDVASLLLELKSRSVLPAAEDAASGAAPEEESIESPSDLVERLLEFKEYRDAAAQLETLRVDWSKRYTRAAGLPPREIDPAERPIEGVELWDLVSAFARVMRDRIAPVMPETIYYDDTPIHRHMLRVDAILRAAPGPVPFEDLFPAGPIHKSTLVGIFLAMLELVRYRHALTHQPERYGPITLEAGPAPLDVSLME
ncbi:Segregation and condensation protein A [Botrimarina colliarenosi]|uniref:Segregation and condensation protein A n=1 Tax=Botrimarina colliarenosi TaxID=2528001 RepID=A0A5C6AH01_9BACT|nr:ScpA family protein [Botrimarina colliarenosi]TWT99264.1 Segregation and condensation protein A [Botrimarina colliarenosi]